MGEIIAYKLLMELFHTGVYETEHRLFLNEWSSFFDYS